MVDKAYAMKSKLHMCATDVPAPKAHLGIPLDSLSLVLDSSNAMIVASPKMVLGLSQVLGLAEQCEGFLQEMSTDWETESRHGTQVQRKQNSACVCRTSCYSITDMVTGQTVDASGVNVNSAAATGTRYPWAILLPACGASYQITVRQWQKPMQGWNAARTEPFDLPYSSPSCLCHFHTSLQASAVLQQRRLHNTEESNTN